jgi:hypothetical protein
MKLRNGQWSVLDEEPQPAGLSLTGGAGGSSGSSSSRPSARPGQMFTKYQEFSGRELASIRAQLERLYSQQAPPLGGGA